MADAETDRLLNGRPPEARADWAIGPLERRLTIADLPPPCPRRWLPRLKADVVAAVNSGLLTIDEACDRYQLTAEELASWVSAAASGGLHALSIKSIPQNRARSPLPTVEP
jgi:transposase-like protein